MLKVNGCDIAISNKQITPGSVIEAIHVVPAIDILCCEVTEDNGILMEKPHFSR